MASYDGDRAVRAIMSSAVTTLQHTPTAELPPGGGAVLWLDVLFPQRAHPPHQLVHRIVFTEFSSPQRRGIVNGTRTQVSSRAPVVLGPPLLGAGYVDGNGCCGESAVASQVPGESGVGVAPLVGDPRRRSPPRCCHSSACSAVGEYVRCGRLSWGS